MDLPNGNIAIKAGKNNTGTLVYTDRDKTHNFDKKVKNWRDWTPLIISYNSRTVTVRIDDEHFSHELHEDGVNGTGEIVLYGDKSYADFADFNFWRDY